MTVDSCHGCSADVLRFQNQNPKILYFDCHVIYGCVGILKENQMWNPFLFSCLEVTGALHVVGDVLPSVSCGNVLNDESQKKSLNYMHIAHQVWHFLLLHTVCDWNDV